MQNEFDFIDITPYKINDTCNFIFSRGQFRNQKCGQKTNGKNYCETHQEITRTKKSKIIYEN